VFGIIYLITNVVNGKKYIGQTTATCKRRYNAHKRAAFSCQSQLPLHRAMRKYSINNFSVEMIEKCNSIESLNAAESKWIAKLETFGPGGYNCTTGGEGFIVSDETKQKISNARAGVELSEEHCKAISASMKGENNPFYGRTHSEETIIKIKETLVGKMDGEKNPFYGKQHSEESRRKISTSLVGTQVGEKHSRAKLTEKDVLEIRAAVQRGISRSALAKQYNVGVTAIDKIVRKQTWKHI
jgi:group I intron endonuclease